MNVQKVKGNWQTALFVLKAVSYALKKQRGIPSWS